MRYLFLILVALMSTAVVAAERFPIHPDQYIGDTFVGFGACMSPYITCPQIGQKKGNLDDLRKKMINLGLQHVRIFVLTEWWDIGSEAEKQSFIDTVKLAQDAGATVNLTLWYGWRPDPQGSSKQLAEICRELIEDHKLTAVQYVTLQNEVNSTPIPMEAYNDFYRMFDRDLRKANLRDKIKIVSGDLVGGNHEEWLESISKNIADISDGYSEHIYWDYWDEPHMLDRLEGISKAWNAIPADKRRPMYLTEFGIRGQREDREEPGRYADGRIVTKVPDAMATMGRFMIETINRGFVAAYIWDAYDQFYDKPMYYGLVGAGDEGWPIRPGYELMKLFTHTGGRGYRAIKVDGESKDVHVAAMRKDNAIVVYATNEGKEAVEVSVEGLSGEVHRQMWDVSSGKISDQENGNATVTIPAKCVMALTTK